jgi:23S rRNA (guanosine2251-2'-O)-methyltransferase
VKIEGRNAVIEALRAGMPLERVMIAEGTEGERPIAEVQRLVRDAGVPLAVVPRRDLDRASERGAHQGVIALAAPFRYADLADVLASVEGRDSALVIALDHVTDPGNLGAIVRSAEVVGAAAVLVQKRRSAAVTPAAWKAAAGALAHVPVVQEPNLVRSLEQFKQAGFWVAGASEKGEQVIWDAPLDGRIVLVMGSEGEGLARLTAEACDFLVRLPQAGRIGSLNVAQAATALSYEWLRRQHGAS